MCNSIKNLSLLIMVRSKQQFVPFGNRNFIEVIDNFAKARSEYLLSTAIIEKFTQRLCILCKIHEKDTQQSMFKGYLHRQLLTQFWHDLNSKCNIFMYRTYHIVSWRFTILLWSEIGRQHVKAPLATAINPDFDLPTLFEQCVGSLMSNRLLAV